MLGRSLVQRGLIVALIVLNFLAGGLLVREARATNSLLDAPCSGAGGEPTGHCTCNWATNYCTHNGWPTETPCGFAGKKCKDDS